MTEVIVAGTAGFCSGIKRAAAIAEKAASDSGKAYTIGRLIHNSDALRMLCRKNVFTAESLDDIPEDAVAVIKSHGAAKSVYDALAAENRVFADATCPYVKKIHRLVSEYSRRGYAIIIAGDENHPEIIGTAGHICPNSSCFIIKSADELEKLVKSNDLFRQNALIMVSQSTFNVQKWQDCVKILKNHCTNAEIFDTICNATVIRQEEAKLLAAKCDFVIVLGSPDSSNSRKLAEVCRGASKTGEVLFAENASALDLPRIRKLLSSGKDVKKRVKAGITAGASVPAEIIEEVHNIMNEEIKNKTEMTAEEIDFLAEVDKTFQKIYIGKRVKACVISVNNAEVVVDLGIKHSGYIPADELSAVPGATPENTVKPGDEIECVITSINDAEGIVYLSKKRVDSALGFEKLSAAFNENSVLEGTVVAVVNGGVIVSYEGTRVFVPASQSGIPKTGKLEELLKKNVKFKVIEVNEQRSRVVGSVKAALRQENDAIRTKFWEEIAVGKRFIGEVKSIESYGVFVDLGGVDGMVHLSELTWDRIKHPKELVNIGDKLEVYVKSFSPERKRVSLGAKNPDENPWLKFTGDFEVGQIVKATVVNITPFGAFAQIVPGIDGLIHISQISNERVTNVAKSLELGQEVEARITEIDIEKERVSISIKALLSKDDTDGEEAGEAETVAEEETAAGNESDLQTASNDIQEVIAEGTPENAPEE